MRKAFTIIELLVASLLLGMLVTILTMIFNQSSIAWRTGIAGTSDMRDVRMNIATWSDLADNVFAGDNRERYIVSPWKTNKELWDRANSLASGYSDDYDTTDPAFNLNDSTKASNIQLFHSVGSAQSETGGKNYIVNVMSAGPDREFDTYDDIWSWPDEWE